ncbi:MAG TPA: GFA family protein [Candidatus Binataceae bacterium]|nr:GFA family protein [Candidatus Binataceae bacterium]
MASAKGGCLCGAVRYECSADPVFMGNCHCRDCQQLSGSAYAAAIGVPRSALKITGDVKYYESKADSGNMAKRGFCPACGSPLFSLPPFAPDLIVLRAASLDDPSIFKPAVNIYTSSAQPWDLMDPALPKFPKMPPMN